MYLQRLLVISSIAIGISTVLLGIYWLYYRWRSRSDDRIARRNELDLQLEEHLANVPEPRRSTFRDLMLVKSISSAMLIVSFCFFLVGGVSSEFSPQEIRFTFSDPATTIAIFGGSLWGLSLAALYISEGVAAISIRGIVAKTIPGFTKTRYISGSEAISFGIKRILIGIGFLSVIVFMVISVLML